MQVNPSRWSRVVGCLAVAPLLATNLSAAVLEEVIVTAQKREQSIQDVGIAITAFTGDQLHALGVEQSFDAASFSPGVHISGNLAGQNTQFSIRGVTQNDFNDIVEAPNAVYLDDGYLAIALNTYPTRPSSRSPVSITVRRHRPVVWCCLT